MIKISEGDTVPDNARHIVHEEDGTISIYDDSDDHSKNIGLKNERDFKISEINLDCSLELSSANLNDGIENLTLAVVAGLGVNEMTAQQAKSKFVGIIKQRIQLKNDMILAASVINNSSSLSDIRSKKFSDYKGKGKKP